MKAAILAGGLGMRLRPYTTILPKPLLPVGDRPVLELIIRRLAATGVREVHLCVGHLGDLIRAYFSEGTTLPDGIELHWHWEKGDAQGTAGALRTVPGLDSTFIAMNGDVVTSLDFGELLDFHRSRGAALTIATHGKRVNIDLGVIESEDGRVVDYREKPVLLYNVSMGVYVYEPRALAHLPDGACQFPDLVLRLLAAGEHVAAFQNEAEWFDIGTVSEYERALGEMARRPELFGP